MRKFEKENKQAGGGCCYGVTGGAKAAFGMLGVLFLSGVSENALAQCVATTDCATLGYTESSCPDGGVKCPFGNGYYCGGLTKEKCADLGFQYSCTGANDGGGAGEDCAGKYAECACSSGYKWKDGACTKVVLGQCSGDAKSCNIADILYTDGTCSADVVSGKTPLAVVVYIGGDGCGQALALEGVGGFGWAWTIETEYVDIPDLQNYSLPFNDFDSCENTKTVIDYSSKQYGDNASEYYPAFWKVYNYAPSTMPETKGKWCLPAGGVLNSISQNKTAIVQSLARLGRINNGFIDDSDYPNGDWWTSDEIHSSAAWSWSEVSGAFNSGVSSLPNYKNRTYYVRPVIEF